MGGDKMSNVSDNPKLALAKAKILFYSEDNQEKNNSIQLFYDIFKNKSIDFKYRLEAFPYIIENYLKIDEAYEEIIKMILEEELDDLKVLTLVRKIKELKKAEIFKNFVIEKVIDNQEIHSNKRYLILKAINEVLSIGDELLIKAPHYPLDLFNIVLVFKDDLSKKDVIHNLLIDKINNSELFEKLIYLNLFYVVYGKIDELISKLLNSSEDYLFLLLMLSNYYKDYKIFEKVINYFYSSKFVFSNLLFEYFIYGLFLKERIFVSLPYSKLVNLNLFYKVLYSFFVKDNGIYDEVVSDINNRYKGVFNLIMMRYLRSLGMEFEQRDFDLSEAESEFISIEDAIIEVNTPKFLSFYQEFLTNFDSKVNFKLQIYSQETQIQKLESVNIELQESNLVESNLVESDSEKELESIDKESKISDEESMKQEVKKEVIIEEIISDIEDIINSHLEQFNSEETYSKEVQENSVTEEEVEDKTFKDNENEAIEQLNTEDKVEDLLEHQQDKSEDQFEEQFNEYSKMEVEEKNVKQFIEQKIYSFIIEGQSLQQDELKSFYDKDKELLKEVMERFIFNEDYFKNIDNIMLLIIEYSSIDSNESDNFIKKLVQMFLGSKRFDLLEKLVKTFELYTKQNFNKYFINNDSLSWSDEEQENLIDFLNYLSLSRNLSVDLIGKICLYIIESNKFSENVSDKIEQLISSLI